MSASDFERRIAYALVAIAVLANIAAMVFAYHKAYGGDLWVDICAGIGATFIALLILLATKFAGPEE